MQSSVQVSGLMPMWLGQGVGEKGAGVPPVRCPLSVAVARLEEWSLQSILIIGAHGDNQAQVAVSNEHLLAHA